ncbi:MAG: outer membrane protein [Mucilaginibacter sp.]|nr:outer membrane protein [Mucilaginibacter sp.]
MKKLIILLLIPGVLSTYAQTSVTAPDTATVNFVTQASKGGMTEVNTGKLAISKGKSADVKAFGARMVADHSNANYELTQLVNSKGWHIPPPAPADVAPDAMLTGNSDAGFDKNYVTMMVQDHKKTVALFQNAAANAPDPAIKAFAAKTLPVLQQHLTSIQAIATKMGIAY